jgi:hypothetical protein
MLSRSGPLNVHSASVWQGVITETVTGC